MGVGSFLPSGRGCQLAVLGVVPKQQRGVGRGHDDRAAGGDREDVTGRQGAFADELDAGRRPSVQDPRVVAGACSRRYLQLWNVAS